jgi:hypothetical protein
LALSFNKLATTKPDSPAPITAILTTINSCIN